MLENDLGRVGQGIDVSYDLEIAAISGTLLLNHNHTIERLLFGAKSRQANH
jgi:hypothetical protein